MYQTFAYTQIFYKYMMDSVVFIVIHCIFKVLYMP